MKVKNIWHIGVLAILTLMVMGLVGCSTGSTSIQSTGKSTLHLDGILPDWNLEEMVERSDAIAIGVIKTELGTRQEAGGINDPPTYYYDFTDYKLEVEQDLYPGTLPSVIVVMAETGVSAASDDVDVVGFESVPSFDLDDRALLFMESMTDEDFEESDRSTTPTGFNDDDYYLVMVGGPFGKLIKSGDKWEDSRSGKSFRTKELISAIEEIKKNSDNE